MGNEGPGIGGVPGIAQGKTRAPEAWHALLAVITKKAPNKLNEARLVRERILRTNRGRK